MSDQPGNRIPTYPHSKPVQSQDPKDAVKPTNGQENDGGDLQTFTGADGGAPEWKSHPGKEESHTIDNNYQTWPNTETARTAKRD